MKKFSFSLNSVKDYKDKLLENLKAEHAVILRAIADQEKLIEELEEKKNMVQDELNEKNSKGITPFELMNYQRYLKVVQSDIEHEHENLQKLFEAEEEKKEELIELKKETTSYEKLKEKKLQEYNFMVNKAQEQFIEEFVSNKKYAGR